MHSTLLAPMSAHLLLTAFLYALLTVVRAPTVWRLGARADGSNPWASWEPRISANLSNQFEWPLFFHLACMMIGPHSSDPMALGLAWIFVLGRLLHSVVQICTRNVRLRGLVFVVNFLAVPGLWLQLWQGAG